MRSTAKPGHLFTELTVVVVAVAWLPHAGQAATPLAALWIAPDATVTVAGATVSDETVAVDDLLGGVATEALTVIPADTAIAAYHRTPAGDHLVVLETTTVVGAVTATAADVVRIDGLQVASLELVGAALGIPPGVAIDALTRVGSETWLSFDTTVALGGTTFADEDLARWDGVAFSMAFDGSLEGVDEALDLDAAHRLENGHLLLSFDGSGTLGGVAADDEDVLELSPGPTWELAFDGSLAHAELVPVDVAALFADVFLLEVAPSGSGSGSITSAAGISCGSDCSEILAPGTVVELIAQADAGSIFNGWTGVACGLAPSCQFTVSGDMSVVGLFHLIGEGPIFADGFESGDTSAWN